MSRAPSRTDPCRPAQHPGDSKEQYPWDSSAVAGAEDLVAGIQQRVAQRVVQTVVVFNDEDSLAQKRSMVGYGGVLHWSGLAELAAENARRAGPAGYKENGYVP